MSMYCIYGKLLLSELRNETHHFLVVAGLFGSQLPTQPSGSSPGSNTANLQNGVMTVGSDRASSPSVPRQFPSSTDNQFSSFLDVPRAIPDAVHPASLS